jgi:hypothetical protein
MRRRKRKKPQPMRTPIDESPANGMLRFLGVIKVKGPSTYRSKPTMERKHTARAA